MANSAVNYFINSNSSKGFVSFFHSNFGHLHNVIRLNGYPSVIASDILSGVCVSAREKGFHAELIHNCLDNSMEGVIIPERNAGIINFPLYDEGEYHIAAILNDENLRQTKSCLSAAQKHFANALGIHDSWEKIYISNMDFAAADRLTAETIEKLIGEKTLKKTGMKIDRFFGAATINGPFDYIENLTADIGKRYFVKGRPGTGKSTFLKRIAENAAEAGFNVEIYHCAFDPDSLDMIILRELDLCLFDSTSPHEYFPSRPDDEVIDIYKAAVADKTDEKYRAEITAIMTDYKAEIGKATKQLGKAKHYYDEVQRSILSKVSAEALAITE
ncbi:MAG: ATPase [Caproiciproducens sp.]|nr:ATPase [Caproiciproducens sp.]